MLNTPNPANGDDLEVEITDLDAPPEPASAPGREKRHGPVLSLRAHVWVSITVIAAIALLVVVLVSVPPPPEPATVVNLPLSAVHPLSLSVVDGIAYASSPDGTVTALRVSDGFLLWHHEGGNVGETSTTVADGAVFLFTPTFDNHALTVRVEALRARDGFALWSHTLPVDTPAPLQLAVVAGILYISSGADRIDALRARDGFALWHYTWRAPFASTPSVAGGVVYAGNQDGQVYALRASDGFPLWQSTSLFALSPAAPTVADGMVYLDLQDGSIDALRTSDSTLLWHHA